MKKSNRLGFISSYNTKKTSITYSKAIPKDIIILEKYINDKTKIVHKHMVCGYTWKVRPNNIVTGYGCPNCGMSFNKNNKAYTYFIYFPELDLYKVGVTNNTNVRLRNFGYKAEVILIRKFIKGKDALLLENNG